MTMIKEWIELVSALEQEKIWPEATVEEREILVTLKLMANTEEKQWEYYGELYTIRPGQLVTSYHSLVQLVGTEMPVAKLRLVIKKFVMLGFLTEEFINEMRIITITNWDSYVGIDDNWTMYHLTTPFRRSVPTLISPSIIKGAKHMYNLQPNL